MDLVSETLARAIAHHRAGKLDEARSDYARVLQADPNHADALHLSGVIAHQEGDNETAEGYIRRAIDIAPREAACHCNLGVVYRAMGRYDEAEACYRKALTLEPNYAEAHNNLGNLLNDAERYAEAADSCRSALQIRPGYADAHNNLGQALQSDGLIDEAIASFQQAIGLMPDLAVAHTNRGTALVIQRRYEEAVASFRHAVRINPEDDGAHSLLGHALESAGKVEEGAVHFREALRIRPSCLRELQLAARCPVVYDSNREIDRCREAMTAEFERLSKGQFDVDPADPSLIGCQPSFALLHHGRNNRRLKEAHADLFRGCFPKFEPRLRSGRPRVGFVVTNGHESIFRRFMWGAVSRFDPDLFDAVVVCSAAGEHKFRSMSDCRSIRFLRVPARIDRIARTILEAEFDLLYYWEVGTDAVNYFLPFYRLAPVQCTSAGIPETSATPEMDYYLSSDVWEPENAQDHYTETLIRAKSRLIHIPPSPKPERATRADFGFGADQHFYLFPHKIHKFHPDMDPLLAEILRRDRSGVIVAIVGDTGSMVQKLRARLARTMPDVVDRLLLVRKQVFSDYFRFVAAADVQLDSLHYSGGTTTYDALSLGTPVVTLPTQLLAGRGALGAYKMMGVMDCVAADAEQYVEIAVRLGTDPDRRAHVSERIRATSHLLFEEDGAVRELEQIILELVQRSRADVKSQHQMSCRTGRLFGIGWHKSGTASLGRALSVLGMRHLVGYWGVANELTPHWVAGRYEEIFKVAEQFDSFEDSPWNHPGFYKELDRHFPGSKFILTVRDEERWFHSLQAMIDGWSDKQRETNVGYHLFHNAVFGSGEIHGRKRHFMETYNRHNRDVMEYFKERPGDLLVMDLEQGDGWEKLCSFLDKPVPTSSFPHINKGRSRLRTDAAHRNVRRRASKLFGIGMHKTGTSTLAACLRKLQFDLCPEPKGYELVEDWASGDYRRLFELAERYNAFEDTPWGHPGFYRYLDARFPGSKFILTTRDADNWATSMKRWIAALRTIPGRSEQWKGALVHQAVFGCDQIEGNDETYKRVFKRHQEDVADYFKDRPDDLLIVDWEKGHGWAELCRFLGEPVPNVSLPHMLKYDSPTQSYVNVAGV